MKLKLIPDIYAGSLPGAGVHNLIQIRVAEVELVHVLCQGSGVCGRIAVGDIDGHADLRILIGSVGDEKCVVGLVAALLGRTGLAGNGHLQIAVDAA